MGARAVVQQGCEGERDMTITRINPDDGVIEEKHWFWGWIPKDE